ncbi:hypothetical protein ACLB2K_072254 [Fragaria x ananassa]
MRALNIKPSQSTSSNTVSKYHHITCKGKYRSFIFVFFVFKTGAPFLLAKGEQFSPEFERLNPLHYVPVLVDGDVVVSDSFAILLYLEEKYPQRPLLPADPRLKALNLQVNFLSYAISALEKLLKDFASKFATGNEVYMLVVIVGYIDMFLAPQIATATARFIINMSTFPSLSRANETYKGLPEFQASSPERQPDAVHGK